MSTAEQILVEVAATPPAEDLSARRLAVAALIDALSIGIAGMSAPGTQITRSVLGETEAGTRSWSGTSRYAVTDVALLHGTACHSLDWDDYMHPMHGHVSSVLLGALWGVAEREGASGADLVDAFLVGYDVDWLASQVFSHGHYRRGWHATSTIGVLGAAAATARLRGLTPEQCAAALGIAASSAGGLQANFGTPTKGLHAGLAARAGLLATELAAAGMTAGARWLTGQHGMLDVFGADVSAAEAAGVMEAARAEQPGITTIMGLVQKPFASCGCSHAAVDAVVSITGDLAPADIQRIEVHVDPAVTRTMREQVPSDEFNARYSPSWVVAAAATDGDAGPAQFSRASLERAEVRALRERVEVITDLAVGDDDRFGARVVVHTASGAREAEVPYAPGHPARPLSEEQRRAKALRAGALASDDAPALLDVVTGCWDDTEVRESGDRIRSLVRPSRGA